MIVKEDEGVRADATVESMAALKPIMKGGVVTAGNASQQNDAAAACLIVAEDKLASLGLTPMGFLVGWSAAGCHPATMGLGPVPAVAKLFKRTGLSFDDMDLVELNDALQTLKLEDPQIVAVVQFRILVGWEMAEIARATTRALGY